MNYWMLAGGWALYFLLHSLFAADAVKRRLMNPVGRYYRIIYSVLSTVGLVALMILNGSVPSESLFESTDVIRYLSLMFTTFGVMTMQMSFKQYRLKAFLGFAEEKMELKIEGVLKQVRHPIYSGLILVTIGFFLFIPTMASVVSCFCIFAYLPIGIYLEERKLIAAFGESYLRYKKEVPAILPRLFAKKGS